MADTKNPTMNAEPEHTGEELIRLRAENRSLAADLFLAKKEAHDWKEWGESVASFAGHTPGCGYTNRGSDCDCGLTETRNKKPESPK